jgi:hypothetical protein
MDFIKSLNDTIVPQTGLRDSNGKRFSEGHYIGLWSSETVNGGSPVQSINYSGLVDDLFTKTNDYFSSYPDMYNNLLKTYGQLLTNLLINNDYRVLKTYSGGSMGDIELFGLYKSPKDLASLVDTADKNLQSFLTSQYNSNSNYILDMLKISNLIPNELVDYFSATIHFYIIRNMSVKFKTMLEVQSITQFESKRNDLVKVLDKLNFVVNNGYDVKLKDGKTTKATFTTPISFNDQFLNCINYINDNSKNMYKKLNTSIDFNNPVYNFQLAQDIIQTFYYVNKDEMITELGRGLFSDIDLSILDKVNKKLTQVFYVQKEDKIKFLKSPIRKNGNGISYVIDSEILDTTTDEINDIFSGDIKIQNKLK